MHLSQWIGLYVAFGFAFILGSPLSIHAQMNWAAPQSDSLDSNRSALSTLGTPTLHAVQVLDLGQTARLQQDLEDLNREFEMRQKFNLLTWDEMILHQNRVKEFSQEVLSQIRNYQVRQAKKKIIPWIRGLQNDDLIQAMIKPMAVLMGGLGFYLGDPLDLALTDDIRILMQTHFRAKRFQFILSTPLVESSLDWVASSALVAHQKRYEEFTDPLARANENFRVSLSRVLPVWDIYTGVYYGSSSKFLGASLSKSLFSNLNCVFDVVFPLDPAHSELKMAGEAIHVSYYMNF